MKAPTLDRLDMSRLYDELAQWYPLLTHVSDYEEEAAFFTKLLAGQGPSSTLLELGCGQGANAFYMKSHFNITLSDRSERMLKLSRTLNPGLQHVQGDMRDLRLDVTFDRVFVHDAISYLTTGEDLHKAIETIALHLSPGGMALLAPDYLAENFVAGWDDGGHDAEDGRGLRFIEYCQDPDPNDDTYRVDYAMMLREPDGTMRVEHDTHVEGLFSRQSWLDRVAAVGLSAETVVFEHSDLDDHHTYEVIVCRKPHL